MEKNSDIFWDWSVTILSWRLKTKGTDFNCSSKSEFNRTCVFSIENVKGAIIGSRAISFNWKEYLSVFPRGKRKAIIKIRLRIITY